MVAADIVIMLIACDLLDCSVNPLILTRNATAMTGNSTRIVHDRWSILPLIIAIIASITT
jgi:hypothetical protein